MERFFDRKIDAEMIRTERFLSHFLTKFILFSFVAAVPASSFATSTSKGPHLLPSDNKKIDFFKGFLSSMKSEYIPFGISFHYEN